MRRFATALGWPRVCVVPSASLLVADIIAVVVAVVCCRRQLLTQHSTGQKEYEAGIWRNCARNRIPSNM
jgi:hypothetical protein